MSSDEKADVIWEFALGDTVEVMGPDPVERRIAIVSALVFDGLPKYRLSWFLNGEPYETELPAWRVKAIEKPSLEVSTVTNYDRLKPYSIGPRE